jgi:hypothetical protein
MRRTFFLAVPALLLFTQGCGSSLAQPFDQMKSAPITVYRLQNFEPPPQQAAAPAFQLPPQIQQWVQQGAAMLPPGLIPPGLIPGAAAPAPPAQDAMRFHGFRVLGWKPVPDEKTHDEVLDIFGHESNFVTQHDGCMFAEFGVSIQQQAPQPADILISLSCDQAASGGGFQWPYAKNGISADTAKRIVAVVQKTFGG